MGLRQRVGLAVAALLGIAASTATGPGTGLSLDDERVESLRDAMGGQLSPMAQTRTRWFLSDLEAAQRAADVGDLGPAAQLWRAMKRDATLSGLLSTRTKGVVRLPRRFRGLASMVQRLEGRGASARKLFDELCPPAELAALADDGIGLGVGVAELVPVPGRWFPVLRRLEPEFLRYRWAENRWYYQTIAGPIAIDPGDARWVLHIPGGAVAPWSHGLWHALGEAWINKTHARLNAANWQSKLANPARAAVAPPGATETQRAGFLQRLISWGINTVFELPVGWDVKLIESNGRGFDSFVLTQDRSDREYAIAVCGQVVTVDGGAGFSNADVHRAIRSDLIQDTADGLAYTVNTQILPALVFGLFGWAGLEVGAAIEWDVSEPRAMTSEAATLQGVATAITTLSMALEPHGKRLDVSAIATRFGVPVLGDANGDGAADEGEPEELDADLVGGLEGEDVDVSEFDAANDDGEEGAAA